MKQRSSDIGHQPVWTVTPKRERTQKVSPTSASAYCLEGIFLPQHRKRDGRLKWLELPGQKTRREKSAKRQLQRSSEPLESSAEDRSEHACEKTTQGWGNNQPTLAEGKSPKLAPSQE